MASFIQSMVWGGSGGQAPFFFTPPYVCYETGFSRGSYISETDLVTTTPSTAVATAAG